MITLLSVVRAPVLSAFFFLIRSFTGGTSGSVLASRLSEDPHTSVLLLEKGPLADSWTSRIPLIGGNPSSKDYLGVAWQSVPQPNINNRSVSIMRGEALGGASRINGTLYTRGQYAFIVISPKFSAETVNRNTRRLQPLGGARKHWVGIQGS